MKLNLTIDARLIFNSGIGVYLQNVVTSSALQGFKPKLLVRSKDKSWFKEKLPDFNLAEFDAELYSIKELLEAPAKTKGADVFWSPHYNVPVINFAKTLKVTTIHDVFHLAYYDTLSTKQKIYARLMMNRAVQTADLIFTVSEFSKSEILKYTDCKPKKVHVVYNGIDCNKFSKQQPESIIRTVLAKYKISNSYILYVGNVKPHKNLEKALLGYKLFLEQNRSLIDEVKFVIVGKRDGFITGDEKVKGMLLDPFFKERVIFTGWVKDEDLPVLYQKSLLFVFPSLYEGFGFPALEAMAAGCPVISSDAACLPEIYKDVALYFNPESEEEIAAAILEMVSNDTLRGRLVEQGLIHAKTFTWEKSLQKKIALIESEL